MRNYPQPQSSVMVVLAITLSLVSVGIGQQSSSSSAAPGKAAKTSKVAAGPVHEIELPQYPPELPDGPNKAVFDQKCLLCHSARYVTMQPKFPKAAWEKTVKKMADVYGAPITPAEQQQIVEYLVAIKGPDAGK